MAQDAAGVGCPGCKKPLEAVAVSDRLGACAHCGKRVRLDDRYRAALAIATANEGWVEKVFWREDGNDLVSVFMVLFVHFPRLAILYAGPVALFLSLYLVASIGWAYWLLVPAGLVAAFVLLTLARKGLERLLADQLAAAAYFVVSSRGLVVLASYRAPLFLPWSSIRDWNWWSDTRSMASQITLRYATAAQQVATIVLHGEEREQPLGELVDILQARLGS